MAAAADAVAVVIHAAVVAIHAAAVATAGSNRREQSHMKSEEGDPARVVLFVFQP
jgi:hypothetical protein